MWRYYVKDILMLLFTASFLLIAPAAKFLFHGETTKAFIIFSTALFLGVTSFYIATYWHERDIHATLMGNIASLVLFVVGIIALWVYQSYFWLPIVLLITLIIYGYFTGKK